MMEGHTTGLRHMSYQRNQVGVKVIQILLMYINYGRLNQILLLYINEGRLTLTLLN